MSSGYTYIDMPRFNRINFSKELDKAQKINGCIGDQIIAQAGGRTRKSSVGAAEKELNERDYIVGEISKLRYDEDGNFSTVSFEGIVKRCEC